MPTEMKWTDGLTCGGGRNCLLVRLADGQVVEFTGSTIPGAAVVLTQDYEKNGKWSNTTFRLAVADTARAIPVHSSWTKEAASYSEAAAILTRMFGQDVSATAAETLIRSGWEKAARRIDETAAALAAM